MTVTNTGTRRTTIDRLALETPGSDPVALTGAQSAYLLSGATRVFRLASPGHASAGTRLAGTGDTGAVDAQPMALAAR